MNIVKLKKNKGMLDLIQNYDHSKHGEEVKNEETQEASGNEKIQIK